MITGLLQLDYAKSAIHTTKNPTVAYLMWHRKFSTFKIWFLLRKLFFDKFCFGQFNSYNLITKSQKIIFWLRRKRKNMAPKSKILWQIFYLWYFIFFNHILTSGLLRKVIFTRKIIFDVYVYFFHKNIQMINFPFIADDSPLKNQMQFLVQTKRPTSKEDLNCIIDEVSWILW